MKSMRIAICCSGVVAIISGCTVPGPGNKPGDVPPRLVIKNNVASWDNSAAFGPVPAELLQAGQRVCMKLDTKDAQYKAGGYHSGALDVDGKPIRGGGYYCVKK